MPKTTPVPLMGAVDKIAAVHAEVLASDYAVTLRNRGLDEEVYRIAEGLNLLVQARLKLERARATLVAKGITIT